MASAKRNALCGKIECNTSFPTVSLAEQTKIIYKKYQSLKPEKGKEYNKYDIILRCFTKSCSSNQCNGTDLHYRSMYLNTILQQYLIFSQKKFKSNELVNKIKTKLIATTKKYPNLIQKIMKEKINVVDDSSFAIFEAFFHDYVSKNKII